MHAFGVKDLENAGQQYFPGVLGELLVYFMGIIMILSIFYCILSITLLCLKFGIAKNYAIFGGKCVFPIFGLCKEYDILQVCVAVIEVYTSPRPT